MDIKMLSKRYSTPTYIKAIGSILFIAVFVIMLVLPVFELIPQDQYINVFNLNGVAKGDYSSETYTIFSMMQNDYGNGLAAVIFILQCALSVCAGIFLLWVNRPKLAAIPASVLLWTVIFSSFRSAQTPLNKAVAGKLFTGPEFWGSVNKNISSIDSSPESATGFVQQYNINGKTTIFNMFGQYWLLWVCAFVLLAFVIFAIVCTKTLIEKKK